MKWSGVLELHSKASSAFADAAAKIHSGEWLVEKEPGKWSPAHVVKHLSLAYEILLSELGGGAGMMIRTSFWQRTLLRFTMVPKLLRGEPFPKGARAPRETRPVEVNADQKEAVTAFRKLAAAFEETVQKAYAENSKAKLTHAYFGRANLVNSVLLCARHVAHHAKHL